MQAGFSDISHFNRSFRRTFGDTPYDVIAAKRIELRTIALLCGGFPEDELQATGAIALFRDPADLLEHYARSALIG